MRVDKEKETNLIVKQWKKMLILIVLLGITAYSVVLISGSFTSKKSERSEIVTYKQTPSLTYTVNLKENNFFESKTLPMNRQYITKIIDNIEANFNYVYNSNKAADLNYTYSIDAVITGKNTNTDGEVEVWSKSYTLLEPVSESAKNSASFTISKKAKIDYGYYSSIVESFRTALGINIDAILKVKLNVRVTGNYEGKSINETAYSSMDIPLGVTTMKIDLGTSNINSNTIYDKDEVTETKEINYVTLAIGAVLTILSLVGIIIIVKQIIRLTRKTEYTMEINKILRTYGDIIAEAAQLPDYSGLEVIDILTFQDMVDIEEELRIPIIYCQASEEVAWFTIIHENRMYRYIVD